ncbi:MAG: PilZ domain [Deltaproteobacteria bacterium]|nr:PilZ domain [Deltaproteobacteria bacterium]
MLFEPRLDLAVPIAVQVFRRDGEAALEYATNLSPGGVCLHARLRLAVGEGVTVAFALPGEDGTVRARGRVTWREDDDPEAEARFLETGVRFEVVDETDRERITRFVREAERE